MEKSEIIKSIPREIKIELLEKLRSGRYKMIKPYEPQPKLTFDLQEDGLYRCTEDRRLLTAEEIKVLPGYMLIIERVSKPSQINHEEPVDGFALIPFGAQDYLNGLLVNIETNEISGGDFNAALKDLSNDELKQLLSQLRRERDKGIKRLPGLE